MSLDRRLPAWVLDLLEVSSSSSVLEIGSGPGVGVQLASTRAAHGRVVGVDPSETMIEMARRRNRESIDAARIELRVGTADRLPFDDATFDAAMVMNSLHLWSDPVAGLREVRRTLRKGGRIAVAITKYSYASGDRFEEHLTAAGFADTVVHTSNRGTCAVARA